jgi:hypothetical protein
VLAGACGVACAKSFFYMRAYGVTPFDQQAEVSDFRNQVEEIPKTAYSDAVLGNYL